jgi:hypothetical protein
VQAVLVPELAVSLVMEDLGLKGSSGGQRTVDVLAESAELGELVHPEVGDRITAVDENQ